MTRPRRQEREDVELEPGPGGASETRRGEDLDGEPMEEEDGVRS